MKNQSKNQIVVVRGVKFNTLNHVELTQEGTELFNHPDKVKRISFRMNLKNHLQRGHIEIITVHESPSNKIIL